jgi:hypothetical protein
MRSFAKWKTPIGSQNATPNSFTTVFQGAAWRRRPVHYADVAGGARIQCGYRPIDVGIIRSVGHA